MSMKVKKSTVDDVRARLAEKRMESESLEFPNVKFRKICYFIFQVIFDD